VASRRYAHRFFCCFHGQRIILIETTNQAEYEEERQHQQPDLHDWQNGFHEITSVN
jgi:hypothetical protein